MERPQEIKRGQLYYLTGNWDFEPGGMEAGRTALVVSSDVGNESANIYVNMVWTTTSYISKSVNVYVKSTHKPFTVLCNKIFTIEKSKLTEYRGEISAAEMAWVDNKLKLALGLSYDKEFKETLEKKEDELKSLRVENDVLKKLYEKAIEQIAELRFTRDAVPAESKKNLEPLPEPKPKPKPQPVITDTGLDLVDINLCSASVLCEKLGFKRDIAENIVAARPYKSVEDLRIVPGVTRLAYQLVESRITVSQVPKTQNQGKVNVNIATAKELTEKTGMNITTAYYIVGYRNKQGKYTCLEELLNVERFGKTCLKKYGPMLEV